MRRHSSLPTLPAEAVRPKSAVEHKQLLSRTKTQRFTTKKPAVPRKESFTFRNGAVIGALPDDARKRCRETIHELRHYRTAISGGQIVVAKSMTAELQSALQTLRAFAQVDDFYSEIIIADEKRETRRFLSVIVDACQREIEKVFEYGGEIYCEIQPHGNSEKSPVMQLILPNGVRKMWYPRDGKSPVEKERQRAGTECGVVRFKTGEMTEQLLEILTTVRHWAVFGRYLEILTTVRHGRCLDDTWQRECEAVFETGNEVICEYNPVGASKKSPVLTLYLPGGKVVRWNPEDGLPSGDTQRDKTEESVEGDGNMDEESFETEGGQHDGGDKPPSAESGTYQEAEETETAVEPSITMVEYRGLKLVQFQELEDEINDLADSNGFLPYWYKQHYQDKDGMVGGEKVRHGSTWYHKKDEKKLCHKDTLNLYDLRTWYIKPMCKIRKCSYAENVTSEPQQPMWFVSHWWGEAVLDFIRCLKKHAEVRDLPQDTAYWVCAYANNQFELGAELGSDPSASSFYRAMALSQGVLMILDPKATPFTRIWCAFEASTAASKGLDLLFDIATVHRGTAEVMTDDGLMPRELEKWDQWEESRLQRRRKEGRNFPVDLLRRGLDFCVQTACATKDIDRKRILNYIIGRFENLDDEPPAEHPKFDEVNASIRAHFAVAGWRPALEAGLAIDADSEFPLARALREDRKRETLFMRLPRISADGLDLLVSSAPMKLLLLDLNFSESELIHANGLWGLARLTVLTTLKLDFSDCTKLENVDGLGGLNGLTSLKSLELGFRRCSQIPNINGLTALSSLAALTSFALHLGGCSRLANMDGLQGLEGLKNLEELVLDMSDCEELTNLDGLQSFAKLAALETLTLHLNGCSKLANANGLHGLRGARRLQSMTLDLSDCDGLEHVNSLKALSALKALRSLKLELRDCWSLANLDGLRGFAGLTALVSLKLVLYGCTDLTNLTGLESMADMRRLETLTVDLFNCPKLANLGGLQGLAGLKSLRSLTLNLGSCRSLANVDVLKCLLLAGLSELQSLTLSLHNCPNFSSADGFRGLAGLTGLRSLRISFRDCPLLANAHGLHSLILLTGQTGLETALETVAMDFTGCSSLENVELLSLQMALENVNASVRWGGPREQRTDCRDAGPGPRVLPARMLTATWSTASVPVLPSDEDEFWDVRGLKANTT